MKRGKSLQSVTVQKMPSLLMKDHLPFMRKAKSLVKQSVLKMKIQSVSFVWLTGTRGSSAINSSRVAELHVIENASNHGKRHNRGDSATSSVLAVVVSISNKALCAK